MKATVIKQLDVFGDDEWYNVVGQTLLEHDQSAHTSIAILEGVDEFELLMEVQNIVKGLHLFIPIFFYQIRHSGVNLLGQARLYSSHLVWQFFVVTDIEPRFCAIGGSSFENAVEFLHKILRKFFRGMVYHEIDTVEMIHGFHDVINVDGLVGDADGVGFKDVSGLVVCEFAAFNVVGIVGEVDLSFMVDAAFEF